MSVTNILKQISCRKLAEKDLSLVLKFVAAYYTPRGVLEQIFKADHQCSLLYHAKRSELVIRDNASFGFFDNSGKMIRLHMAKIYTKEKIYEYPSVEGDGCPGHQAKLRFLSCLEGDACSDLKANKVMDLGPAAGHPAYQGMRLWKEFKIYDLLESCAYENGCDCIVASPVNLHSQKILKQVGFSLVREIKYSDYIDPITGLKPDLDLSEIHTSAMFMWKKL